MRSKKWFILKFKMISKLEIFYRRLGLTAFWSACRTPFNLKCKKNKNIPDELKMNSGNLIFEIEFYCLFIKLYYNSSQGVVFLIQISWRGIDTNVLNFPLFSIRKNDNESLRLSFSLLSISYSLCL